jgi:hypothetical protein
MFSREEHTTFSYRPLRTVMDCDCVPTDCEARQSAASFGGISIDSTKVSLHRCLFADNKHFGVLCHDRGRVRLEGCEFVRNGYDLRVWPEGIVFTDTPASNLIMGCSTCDASTVYGPVLPLTDVPSGKFLTGEDSGFMALQQVCLGKASSSIPAPLRCFLHFHTQAMVQEALAVSAARSPLGLLTWCWC